MTIKKAAPVCPGLKAFSGFHILSWFGADHLWLSLRPFRFIQVIPTPTRNSELLTVSDSGHGPFTLIGRAISVLKLAMAMSLIQWFAVDSGLIFHAVSRAPCPQTIDQNTCPHWPVETCRMG